MDPSTSSSSASNGRQKRVLPSRTRRGGPGVGNCDTDLMILEHQKRRFETEAIIPPTTPFLLTTDTKLFSNESGVAEASVTTVTSERYFDRPDVLKAYREQLTIQTPSFRNVKDNLGVARFRPRGPEDAQIDTSDAAYERRHRKYESFEKRQRLREKEKLKHEQYKLKERIEQLRVMDSSAFLALPASDFSPAPGVSEEDLENTLANLPGAHINGAAIYNEGERRRKEMLDIALSLEERFKVLLPPDRMRRPQPQPTIRETTTPIPLLAPTPVAALAPSRRDVSEVDASEREEQLIFIDDSYIRRQERFKIKLKLAGKGSSQSPAPTTSSRTSKRSGRASVPVAITHKPTRGRRLRVEPSRSPSLPTSSKPVESSQLSTYPSSEPLPSPRIEVEEPLERAGLGQESEEEIILPPSEGRRSSVSSDHKFEMDLAEATERSQVRSSPSPRPLTPPQKRSPLPDTRPALAPEIDPALLEQEGPLEENIEPPRPLPPEGGPAPGSPMRIDEEEFLPRPSPPIPAPVPRQRHPSPPHIEALQNAPPSPALMYVESVSPRRISEAAKGAEEGSRLLQLANVVHSITRTTPPAKRHKTRHRPLPSKTRAPSSPSVVSPPTQPAELEREQTHEPVYPTVVVEEPLLPNDEPMAVGSPPHPTSHSPAPIALSPTVSDFVAPSEGPSTFVSASVPPSMLISTRAARAAMSISATTTPSTAPRRRGAQNRGKDIEYRSPDTGQLMRTQSLLLIAGIRGSARQTARHQMAFGVKVPEEISDPYDFWLPDEYLPEEELMKYSHYDYQPAGGNA